MALTITTNQHIGDVRGACYAVIDDGTLVGNIVYRATDDWLIHDAGPAVTFPIATSYRTREAAAEAARDHYRAADHLTPGADGLRPLDHWVLQAATDCLAAPQSFDTDLLTRCGWPTWVSAYQLVRRLILDSPDARVQYPLLTSRVRQVRRARAAREARTTPCRSEQVQRVLDAAHASAHATASA